MLELRADTKNSWVGAGTKKREMKELHGALENFMDCLRILSHLREVGPGVGPVTVFYSSNLTHMSSDWLLQFQWNEVWL